MTYVSLYRKYRPQTFDDIVGQDHVTQTLKNALTEGRLHHAYLFTGPRGTGKTSTARILAKAVNCVDGPTAAPCNICDSCTDITSGTSVDVIELDMASHGGVDDARELRDRALFSPARSRKRVYILDEVHMASTAAFNALLKLVEEPPSHVLFAMATTDPQKVLPTIMSRVQRLDLRRVSATDVARQVGMICAAEGYQADDDATDLIVRAGDGSLRDTLSILEQVLAFSGGNVTAKLASQVLGTTPAEHVFGIVSLLAARNVSGVLAGVQDLVDGGHDLRRFTLDLAQHVRDLLVLKVAVDRPDLVDATAERRAQLREQAEQFDQATLVGVMQILGETVAEQRQTAPRLPLELALARIAVPAPAVHVQADGGSAAVAPQLPITPAEPVPTVAPTAPAPVEPALTESAPVESEVAESAAVEPAPVERASVEPAPAASATVTNDAELVLTTSGESALGDEDGQGLVAAPTPEADELELIKSNWDAILEQVKQQSRRCHALFEPAVPTRAGRRILTLRYARRYASFHAVNARKAEFSEVFCTAVKELCGLDLKLEVVVEGDDDRRRPLPPSVTPDDARTAVLDNERAGPPPSQDTPTAEHRVQSSAQRQVDVPTAVTVADDETDVREAESVPAPVTDVDSLLATELGAQLLEERPPTSDA